MADRFLRIIGQLVAQMTGASEFSAPKLYERLLAQLVEHFGADHAYLRHENHAVGASMLVAEWPPRYPPGSESDCVSGDAIRAGGLHAPTVIVGDRAMVVAPLLWGTVTTGVIGLTKARDAQWEPEELDTIEVVAALFAQLQARVAAESRLHRLADHDELTGLYNRRALNIEMRRRLAAGRSGPVAALFIDVDRLKSVNDHLGHAAGDVVIRTCAQRLATNAGPRAMVARVGGDEFVVIPYRVMSVDDAQALARQLQAAVCSQVRVAGELITRTLSIGVAIGRPGIDTSDELLRRADHAALAAKRKGGNAIVCEKHAPMPHKTFHESAEPRLAGVIEVHYQPEVDLRTGDILAVEALPFWQPARAMRPADADVDAELTPYPGRSIHLVLRRACGDLSRWRSHGVGLDVGLSLKISPMQLADDRLLTDVSSVIGEFDVDPASIRLGISERDALDAQSILVALKDVGVRIAIVDYGCGNVALPQLKSAPIDTVKIDARFARDLDAGEADLPVIRAIVGTAEAAGVELTAQGVATSTAAAALLRHRCHRAQGSILSRPVCDDVMESLLMRRRIPLPHLVTRQLRADRLTADTTARSDAVVIDGAMPTPHTV